jgi:sortase A
MASGASDPQAPSAIDRVVHVLRTRKAVRRGVSAFSILLLIGGVAMLGYPLFTNLYQDRVQGRLEKQLASPDLQQAYREKKVAVGDSLTRIKIPAINVDVVVVEGTTAAALRAGAGHYTNTPLPCEVGNVAIAGHRTTYGKPFANVDRLKAGDTVELDTPIGGCVYTLSRDPFVVDKADISVVRPPEQQGGSKTDRWLTLTSCHPKGSAAQRIIVRATYTKGLSST